MGLSPSLPEGEYTAPQLVAGEGCSKHVRSYKKLMKIAGCNRNGELSSEVWKTLMRQCYGKL